MIHQATGIEAGLI